MPALQSSRSRFFLLGALYFAQGVPFGFVTSALVVRLAPTIGSAGIGTLVFWAQLPWIAKPLIGALIDRAGGRRRAILAAEVLMAASLLPLLWLPAAPIGAAFLALVFLHSLFAAWQDVATDSLALDLLPPAERGRANAVMAAAKYGGAALVGGPALIWVATAAGWTAALLTAVILLLLPAPLVLRMTEPARAALAGKQLLREAIRSFALPVTRMAALFALLVGASLGLLYPVVVPLLSVRFGLSQAQIGLVVMASGAITAAGNLAGGVLADRIGRRRTLAGAAIAVALAHAGFAASAPLWPALWPLVAYVVASALAGGVLYTAILAFFMDVTNPRVAATHFQIYMALLVARGAWGSKVGGWLGQAVPVPTALLAAVVVELAALALFARLDPRRAQEAFARSRPIS